MTAQEKIINTINYTKNRSFTSEIEKAYFIIREIESINFEHNNVNEFIDYDVDNLVSVALDNVNIKDKLIRIIIKRYINIIYLYNRRKKEISRQDELLSEGMKDISEGLEIIKNIIK